jgi:hypothetical protein
MLAHEVKHVTGALEGKLMPPVTKWIELADLNKNPLFEVIKVSDDHLKKGTIAKIEVAETWVDKLQISPYSPLLEMATNFILLWCMQPSLNHFSFENKIVNLTNAIEECWLFSCQVCMTSYFTNKSLNTLENLEIIDQEFLDLTKLFKMMIEIKNELSPETLSLFSSEMKDTGYFLNVIRMLLSTFINCFKHFDPLYPVNVNISRENQNTRIEIRNKINIDVCKISATNFANYVLRSENTWTEQKINDLLETISQRHKASGESKNTDFLGNDGTHTDRVLLTLAKRTDTIYSSKIDGSEYITTFVFNKF